MALNFYQYTKSADKYGSIATPEPVKASEPGLLSNMGRSAASGALSGVGGIFDFAGADGIAKQFYAWSDDALQSMSAEAQTDIAKPFFSENDQGEIQLGEGLTDLDTWLLTMANVAGQFAPTAIPGAGLANTATKALKLGETGAKIATAVGMGATGGASATGQGMEQARQEWKQMPDELKLQSDLFKNTIREMKQKQPDLDGEALWTAAEDTVAERLASEVQTDPKVLMANFAGSTIADPIIGRALTGARLAKSGAFRSAAKGFAIEGGTEAGQAAVQEYGINQALSQVDGRDPMDGVAIPALNEGIAGGMLGAAAGGVGGLLNRKQAEPVKDREADAIRDKNPDLASAFDGMAQSAAQREADLQSIIGGMPAISQPALEGELLDPEQLAGANFNPNQIGMQARIGGPTIPRINQKDVIFAADGRTEAERNPAMEGEWLSPEQRAANTAGFIENAPIDLESEQVKQAKADMERMRNEPRQITDKYVIFAGDGRPQQAAQDFTDNLQRQANQAASVPQLPQKDIIFAGDQSGVRVKGNGEVYKSPREAMTSKQARAMKRSGTPVEAVQFGDGWGWRVKEGDSLLQTSTAPGATSEDGGPQTSETLGLNLQQTGPMLAGEVDQINQPAPVQFKKSGDPFKSEKEMKISSSYKAAAATGAELETVPVDGGFGFRVKAAPMEAEVASGGLSEGHDSTQPTSSEPTPTRLGDGAEAPNTTAPTGAAQAEKSNVSLAATVGASPSESIDTDLGTTVNVTQPAVDAEASVIDGAPTGNAATELPTILRTTKKKYIAQQVKQQKLKESSPGYAQAVARLEAQYEANLDRAQAGLTFEQFNVLNDDSPESVNRQAYKALREEFGLPIDMQFSKRRNDESATTTEPSSAGMNEPDGSTQIDGPDSKKPEQVRLIGSQSPLSGSPSQVSSETVQSDAETGNPDIQFTQQNTIKAKPARGVNAKLAKQFIAGIMQRLNGAAGIKVVVLESQAEAEKLWQMSLAGDLVRGAYDRTNNTAYVIAENIKSMDELREVVAHEVIGHGGLQNVISKADYKTFIERLKQTRNNRSFTEQWAQIDNDYEGFSENDKAEELFAYFVQNKPVTGPVKFWWNALKRWLHKALVSVGLAKAGDPDVEAMQEMLESIRAGFSLTRDNETASTNQRKTDAQSTLPSNAGNQASGSDDAKAPSGESVNDEQTGYKFSKTRTTEQADALDKLGLGEEAAETVAERAKRRANETVDTLKSSSFWQRLNEGIFDGLAGIKQAEEAAGITDPNKQGYVSARLASGLSDILHGVFHYGAPEWRDGVVQRKADTKGLLEVFGMLGDDLNDWLAWMGANRAERLMAEGRENNLSKADIDELKAMAAGKEALFEEVRQEYNKINSAIIDLAEEAGLLSAELRGGLDEEWYVPFFRNMEEEVDPEMSGIAAMVHGPSSRKGIAGQSAQIKELKGGRQSTKDLLENIIQRQSTMIDAAIKNKAMAEVVSNLEGTPFMQAVDSTDIAALSQTELNLLQKVKVMRNGKAEAYTVTDPALLRGLLQIHTIGNQSLFNRMARSAKRFLTAGITLSPDFIIKNFVRDAAHAWMINKDGFRFGADSVKGLRKAFAEDEAYRDLIFSGAAFQGGYVHGADPEAAAQQIRRALRSKGLGEKDIQSYMDSLITKGGELLEAYRTASDKVENANRLSTYEAALAAGKSRRQAAYEAKDLMDYSLKGNSALIGTMIDMLPFFNARLQGMSKLVRAMKAGDGDRVLKVLSANLAMKGLKVAAFSLALAAMNDDDERYQELPDWDKDANWHFFIGDEHFRIPKPFELGILFGTMPERMFHYAAGSQPGSDLGKAAAHAVWNTLALNPIPQLVLPFVEVMTNQSFFKNTQIEGMGDLQRQREDRYNAYTSETAKQIGAAFGVSPKMVEHLILGYTGTLGGYVLGMADIAARLALGVEAADTPISRYPVIKAFYQGDAPKTATKFQDEFYDALQSAGEAYGSYKRAVEEGDVVRQQELKESESQALGARVQLNRIQRELSELNKQAELVNNNQSLSGADKRQKLDDIAKRKNTLYQNAYVRHKLGEW
ncbi:LPD38 domain-containing protein [Rheinheimera sp.]|uniref:LPD38 domain-containing protein n=1 Tax=Rheinheimera sp. TaxID=1869214 RepID=UPI003D2837C5